ncbi:L,D-transpeptidase family protein [Mycolicibacterium tokaiense]|uniref:Conserved exported protein of uncharacterized function n=1 Tax=Mycolicibacterium tokaiense TaxID=39695 RepID=A0A378TIG6_9MYCO|nr:L,D-transpeptidase family protein [Mycolicibacterium tokaiense]BBY85148.1 hypothetical protein MTOK_09300 [Mycolicibacterium tokaiense]STZ60344.1 Conserved exported protein of uncharacterised function [Mycolicibacterium tokaiense]
MRRLLRVVVAAACVMILSATLTPAAAALTPWFANSVGSAAQVISVVGTGGSDAKMDVYQRTGAGWQAVAAAIPAKIGSKGMSPNHFEGSQMTPQGVYSLDFAFGTESNPGGGLPYVQVGPDHWWDGDVNSPTYNTMQVCPRDQCPFSLSGGTENLQIPEYAHAVVMGVNKQRVPGKGSAFFIHSGDGSATAGCVSIDDATLVSLMRWLQPGAVVAVAQ